MAWFITRVELRGYATVEQYTMLHNQLRALGQIRIVRGDNGVNYHLPPAEYSLTGNYTAVAVRDATWNIARQIDANCAVFVSEVNSAAWIGLTPV